MLGLLALNVVAFFVITMVCHGELSRSRPPAQHLTAFYMWMSAGGVIGGIFAGLIAPNVFSWVLEYPSLVVAAHPVPAGTWRCRPNCAHAAPLGGRGRGRRRSPRSPAWPTATSPTKRRSITSSAALLVVAGLVSREPLPFAAVIAVVFIIGTAYQPDSEARETMRSFFGVHKITETADGRFRVFMHGTTIHGAERLRDDDGEPITGRRRADHLLSSELADGRHREGACVQRVGGPIKVAVVGLGTGTLRMLRGAGRQLQVLRDRRQRREARARSESFPLSCEQCAPRCPGRARRCAADAGREHRTNTT